jgi:antitoxin component HigA of HigAB toxin-antitoxin module
LVQPGSAQEPFWALAEVHAVENAIRAMSTPEGAEAFKKQMRNREKVPDKQLKIKVIGKKQGKSGVLNQRVRKTPRTAKRRQEK